MYDKFTPKARQVLVYAEQQARDFNHEYIMTEHILLGLIKDPICWGVAALVGLGCDFEKVKVEIIRSIKLGPTPVTISNIPLAQRAKKIIEYSIEEARNFNSDYLGTEHILLGIAREHDGAAARALRNVDLKYDEIRNAVARVIVMRASNDPLPTRGAFLPKAPPSSDAPPPFSRSEVRITRVMVRLDPPVEMFSVSVEQPIGSSIQSIPTERELEWYLKGVKDGSRGTIGIPKIPERVELVCRLAQG